MGEVAGAVDEIPWAVRMVLQALARRRPLVLILEDLHWAEPTFLDLVEHLVDLTADAPIMLLCLARGELLDDRPTWGGGKRNATTLELEALHVDEARVLLANLGGPVEPSLPGLERIMAAAEGNPLFLEQMTAMMAERPLEASNLPLPPTIRALLAARLERLGPGEQNLLERAAVIGKDFQAEAVAELLPAGARPFLRRHIDQLVRRRFVRPGPSRAGEGAFRFRHVLIQEATYGRISKRLRAELHRRFADWLEASGEPPDEILGYHLEQAWRYLQELKPGTPAARELAVRASTRLVSAGRRALARRDMNAAANLLSRAVDLLPVGGHIRLELLTELCWPLFESGKLAEAEGILAEAVDQARSRGDRRIECRALIERAALRTQTSPRFSLEEELRTIERAISVLEEEGDDAGLARGWVNVSLLLFNMGKIEAARAAEERVREHARRAGDRAGELGTLVNLCTYAVPGPTQVEEGIELCQRALGRVRNHPVAEARLLMDRAYLEAMRGNFDEARDSVASGRQILEDLGVAFYVAKLSDDPAQVEFLAGDLPQAEGELRSAYDTFRRMGADAYAAGWAAMLARVTSARGRDDEALELTRISEELAIADDITAQIPWRATRARIYARRGRAKEAERLAREAVDLAQRTDWLIAHAEALMDLAEVLQMVGKPLEGMEAAGQALELWEEKGNLVSAARARTLLHELSASTQA